MTRPHHHTKLDRDCERIVRPITDHHVEGYRDGLRGWSIKQDASRGYLLAYWKGRAKRKNQWIATFGYGAAD